MLNQQSQPNHLSLSREHYFKLIEPLLPHVLSIEEFCDPVYPSRTLPPTMRRGEPKYRIRIQIPGIIKFDRDEIVSKFDDAELHICSDGVRIFKGVFRDSFVGHYFWQLLSVAKRCQRAYTMLMTP